MNVRTTLGLCVALGLAQPAAAQDAAAALGLELNRIDDIENACRLTFLVENTLGQDLDTLALETVLIDREGRVDRLTLFEFGALLDAVPRVRQFDIPGLACDALGRVLINGVSDCAPVAECGEALELSTRTEVELIG